ncbi:MAG TPA: ThiF family adenylyltransferase, partial [Rubricoccaceae bacterium]
EISNLHRQPLYTEADVGRLKVDVAADRLSALNPHVAVETHRGRLDSTNAAALIARYDLVADGTDTFATRYLVNDACVAAGRPNVFASISQFSGQAAVFGGVLPGGARGPCYRCVFPEPPPEGTVPSCAEGGVLGALPGLMGTIQATEALKLLLGVGRPLVGRLLLADALTMEFRTVRVDRDPACLVCGDATRPGSSPSFTVPPMTSVPEISATALKARIDSGERPFILDVREPVEYDAANIGGALIPLGELPDRLADLEGHRGDDLVVVHCRSGVRSARAVEILQAHGFQNAVNLTGGIHAWSDEVDPSVPKV